MLAFQPTHQTTVIGAPIAMMRTALRDWRPSFVLARTGSGPITLTATPALMAQALLATRKHNVGSNPM